MNIIREVLTSDIGLDPSTQINPEMLGIQDPFQTMIIIGVVLFILILVALHGVDTLFIDDFLSRFLVAFIFATMTILVGYLIYRPIQISNYDMDGHYLAHIENFDEVPDEYEIIDHHQGKTYWVRTDK